LHGKNTVQLIPIRFPTVQVGQELAPVLINALGDEHQALKRGDILAVASKVVSTCESRIVRLQEVKVSTTARRLARRYGIDERLCTIVEAQSDNILGGVKGFLLTMKYYILTANAGVDVKNAPPESAILWPRNPDKSAEKLRRSVDKHYRTRVGVEIVDSRVTPLRLGTTGLAIGLSGFLPVRDERKRFDLYGRAIRITQTNVADDLAAAAHLLMGEAASRIGAVVIRNAGLKAVKGHSSDAVIAVSKCLVGRNLRKEY
jgi:coenzyme F420-0:L-glutamate ligase